MTTTDFLNLDQVHDFFFLVLPFSSDDDEDVSVIVQTKYCGRFQIDRNSKRKNVYCSKLILLTRWLWRF